MEQVIQWLFENAEFAPMIIFGLLMIAGFSFPVSEDLLLIVSGVLASTVIPERMLQLFLAAFLGSFFSDGIAFGMGRLFGAKVYATKWFSVAKREKLETFYKKYGVLTLVIGRCIPFGFRNGIFMSAGAGNMPFGKFVISDGIACFLFSLALFSIAYACGKNYEGLASSLHYVGIGVLAILVVSASIWLIRRRLLRPKAYEHS